MDTENTAFPWHKFFFFNFQPFKNARTILGLQFVQKQMPGQI